MDRHSAFASAASGNGTSFCGFWTGASSCARIRPGSAECGRTLQPSTADVSASDAKCSDGGRNSQVYKFIGSDQIKIIQTNWLYDYIAKYIILNIYFYCDKFNIGEKESHSRPSDSHGFGGCFRSI